MHVPEPATECDPAGQSEQVAPVGLVPATAVVAWAMEVEKAVAMD